MSTDPRELAERAVDMLTASADAQVQEGSLPYRAHSQWLFTQLDKSRTNSRRRALAEFAYARALDASLLDPALLTVWSGEEVHELLALTRRGDLVQKMRGCAGRLASAANEVEKVLVEVFSIRQELDVAVASAASEIERKQLAGIAGTWAELVGFGLQAVTVANYVHLSRVLMPHHRVQLAPGPLLGKVTRSAKHVVNEDLYRLHVAGVSKRDLAQLFFGASNEMTCKQVDSTIRRLHQGHGGEPEIVDDLTADTDRDE